MVAALAALCSMSTLTVSTPVRAGATAPEAVSVAYQVDTAHDGDQPNETLPPSPVEKWSHVFGNSVSYPLIVGDRVYVTVSGDAEGAYGSELYALDASDGNVLWGPIQLGGTYYRAGIAYDNGLVFAINFSGQLTAFEATTGYEKWGITLPVQWSFTSPPTASGGVVYVSGAGIAGTLYAVDETDGELLWTASVANGDHSSPAVSDTGVYVSYDCEQTYDFAPTTGDLIWHHDTSCEGGGGRTPVLYNGNLYVRDDSGMIPAVLSASTGGQVGTFSSTTAPAFDNGLEFTMENGTLTAIQTSTGTAVWSQTADGSLDSAPIVVGGNVYVAGSSGLVASFNESTGAETWSANAGSPFIAPDEHNVGNELTGLGAGDDLLVVPASDALVAFGADDTSDPPSPGPPPPPPGSITGTVTDSNGAAIAGACVLLVDPTTGEFYGQENLTDANGGYSIGDLAPGSYDLYFLYGCQPYAPGNYAPEIYDNAPDLSSAQGVAVIAGQTTSAVNAKLPPGGQITGIVTDASGNPLSNVAVGVAQVGDVPAVVISTLTGADGTYDLPDLGTGSYLVAFENCQTGSTCQSQFYNGVSAGSSATLVNVTLGSTTANINATFSDDVGATPTPTPPGVASPQPTAHHGYWLVGSDGGIFTFGNAQFYGSTGNLKLQRPVVGITPTAGDGGYWLVASDGGIFAFGDAGFYGSIPGIGLAPAGSSAPRRLNAPIVGMVPTADGRGYFMVASDGGVFAFGDAKFEGSCPEIGGCSGAAVAVVPDASGNGYWLVTQTGHVYAFGDAATNFGAPAPQNALVTSAVRTPDGGGYWILFANGVVGAYGDAASLGGPTESVSALDPATAIFTTSDGKGYWVASANGEVFPYGDATNEGGTSAIHLNGAIIAATGW
jgi:outer membrane protein assembly factor BamB